MQQPRRVTPRLATRTEVVCASFNLFVAVCVGCIAFPLIHATDTFETVSSSSWLDVPNSAWVGILVTIFTIATLSLYFVAGSALAAYCAVAALVRVYAVASIITIYWSDETTPQMKHFYANTSYSLLVIEPCVFALCLLSAVPFKYVTTEKSAQC
jgi:hypothetical protein